MILILERYTSGTALYGTALVISRGLKETKDKKVLLETKEPLVRRVLLEIKEQRETRVRKGRKVPLEIKVLLEIKELLDKREPQGIKVKRVKKVLKVLSGHQHQAHQQDLVPM